MRIRRLTLPLLLTLAACGGEASQGSTGPAGSAAAAVDGIRIEGTWAARISSPHAAALYFIATNDASTDDRLVGATSPDAGSVSLYGAAADGSTTLVPVDAVDVPAGGEVSFEPGGNELVLLGLDAPARVGSTLSVVLEFERAGRVEAVGEVRPFIDPAELPAA